jgi:glutamate synthase (NADPH/NADH) large chain
MPAVGRAIGSSAGAGGLGALAHRGRFGADGETSDGAASRCRSIDAARAASRGAAAARPGIVSLFLPPAAQERQARALVEDDVRGRRAAVVRWRDRAGPVEALWAPRRRSHARLRPGDRRAPAASAAATRATADDAFERRLIVARRRLETRARPRRRRRPRSPCHRVGAHDRLQGPRPGRALADLYPDLRAPLRLSYAVFHQRYATNTHPGVAARAAVPARSSHNGEINTVRGNREEVRGPEPPTPQASSCAASLLAAGPLLSPTAPIRSRSTRRSRPHGRPAGS